MAETITDLDAAASLSRLLAEDASGKSFVIARDGVPVAWGGCRNWRRR